MNNRSPSQKNNNNQGPKSPSQKNSPNRNRNRNSKNYRRGNKGQSATTQDNFQQKYQNILEQYLNVRKKYFELFFRADPLQKAKLERNYHNELKKLTDFQDRLTPEQRSTLRLNSLGPNDDLTYSQNHHAELDTYQVPLEEDHLIEDPHFMQSQIDSSFADDNEETMGNIEDYLKYKDSL